MGLTDEWPEFCPNFELKVDVTSGSLSLVAPSNLLNHADYEVANGEVRGTVFKNGSKQGAITINAQTGALSITAFSVSNGDTIEFRLHALRRTGLPWMTHTVMERSAVLVVSGNGQTVFDGSTNVAKVPAFDLAFGWDSNNALKVGMRVTASDNATQSMAVTTRLHGTCPNSASSSSFSMTDTTNTQSHTATFGKADMLSEAAIEMTLQSAGSAPYQKDRVVLLFQENGDVPTYPASFPTSGTLIKQEKVTGTTKLRMFRP
ncbi:MAG: hypothetical protein ACOZNI_20075 [Myxococcota bacterium]